MKRAVVITTWFGPWKDHVSVWLTSLAHNPGFQFHLITDTPLSYLPSNVSQTTLSFTEYVERVSDVLAVPYWTDNAYALCNLRPFLGKIHADHCQGYDYWGWCDNDMVMGDLATWYHPLMEKGCEVISAYAQHVSGPFALVRNTEANREMALQNSTLLAPFLSPFNAQAGETAFYRLLSRHHPDILARSHFQSLYGIPNGIEPIWEEGGPLPPAWRYHDNRVYSQEPNGWAERPFYHFGRTGVGRLITT